MADEIPFKIESFVAKKYNLCLPYSFKVIISDITVPSYQGNEFQSPGFEFHPSNFFHCAESALEHKVFLCSTEEAGVNHLVFSPQENEMYKISVAEKKKYNFDLNPSAVLPKDEVAYQFLKTANELMFKLYENEKPRLVEMLNYPGLDELYSSDYVRKRFDEEAISVFIDQTKNLFSDADSFSKS